MTIDDLMAEIKRRATHFDSTGYITIHEGELRKVLALLLLLSGCAAPQPPADSVRAACHDAQPFLQAASLAKPFAASELMSLCRGKTGSPEQVRRETEILIQVLYSPIRGKP